MVFKLSGVVLGENTRPRNPWIGASEIAVKHDCVCPQ